MNRAFLAILILVLASMACSVQRAGTPPPLVAVQTPDAAPAESQNATGTIVARFTEKTVSNTAETPAPIVAHCSVLTGINAGALNLRSCAGIQCEIIGALSEGEKLTIVTPGLWLEVRTGDGLTGYINSKFCK